MSYASYVPPAQAATILAAKKRAFGTSLAVGETYSLTFHRDKDDGSDQAIGPYTVLLRRTGGLNTAGPDVSGQATGFVGMSGEFRAIAPFAVVEGDRFTLPGGLSGRITANPLVGPVFVSAPFMLEA